MEGAGEMGKMGKMGKMGESIFFYTDLLVLSMSLVG